MYNKRTIKVRRINAMRLQRARRYTRAHTYKILHIHTDKHYTQHTHARTQI